MSDEFDKGYFSTGPLDTYEAQQGAWKRLEDERRERETAERRDRERQQRVHEQVIRDSSPRQQWQAARCSDSDRAASGGGSPPTLSGCVKSCAVLGAVLMAGYSALGLGLMAWSSLAVWAVQGAFWGAVAGIAAYVALVILGFAMKVLAMLVKFALYAGLLIGVVYLLTQTG